MVYNNEYIVGLGQIGYNNEATNSAILSMMEDIASLHSATVGFGVLDVEKSRKGWVLLNWKVKVIKRPRYNQKICASTWSRRFERAYACRDFCFKDENGEVLVIGTSKWVLFDIDTRRPQRLTEEIGEPYQSEPDRAVFEEEISDIVYDKDAVEQVSGITYEVMRRDIDINEHVHNINYVDIASEALPMDVYKSGHFDNIAVQYKKEVKFGDTVECKYWCDKCDVNDVEAAQGAQTEADEKQRTVQGARHIVVMSVEGKMHAVVELS